MTREESLRRLLEMTLRDRPRRKEHLGRFQKLVWETADLAIEDEVEVLVRDLAYDLDYYEPDEAVRKEDDCYFGDSQLEVEVQRILDRMPAC